jgi:murein tripeptide amidase MpaA
MAKKLPSVRMLLAFVIAFSMVLPTTYIVSLGSESSVEISSPGMNAESRAIVNLGNKVYQAWLEGPTHRTRIMFSTSGDLGQTWSTPVRITNSDTVPLNVQMAAGGKFLHLAWSDGVTKLVDTGYMSYNLADGAWSRPVTFNGEYASLAAFGNSVTIAAEYDLMLMVYSSQDNGQTFETSAPMPELSCTRTAVFHDDGNINVACAAGIRDPLTGERSQQGIYYASTNNPMIWPAQKKLADISGSVNDLKIGDGKITWTELTQASILKYSMLEPQNDLFGPKVLLSSEPIVIASETPIQTLDAKLPPKKWTFVCYLDGDNSLASFATEDLNEMELVGSTADLNIIALYDITGSADSVCYYVTYDTDTGSIASTVIPLGSINASWSNEVNMGNPQTGVDLMMYVYANYPAERYAWDFWDHGGSWNWMQCEDAVSVDELTALDTRTIYEKLRNQTGRRTLWDVVCFDECILADTEVVYDAKQYCNYTCFSEDSIAGPGFDYTDVLNHLKNDPDMNGEEFGAWVCHEYYADYPTGTSLSTLSEMNNTAFDYDLMPAINSFGQKMRHKGATLDAQISSAASSAMDWQGITYQPDLRHFAQLITTGITNATDAEINAAAWCVIGLTSSNAASDTYGSGTWQSNLPIIIHDANTNANGLTVYANEAYDTTYETLKVSPEANWGEFVQNVWGTSSDVTNEEPTCAITSPTEGSYVVLNTNVLITGTASDALDGGTVQRVEVKIDREAWKNASGTTSWSYTWNLNGWAPGPHRITARAYDGTDYSEYWAVKNVTEIVDPTLPDLSIVPAGISFDNPAPDEGEVVTITAVTWNNNSYPGAQTAGNATNPVRIGFYDGNPATGGTQIAIINTVPSILPIGTSGTASTTWNTAGYAGYHEIYAVADPLFAINELTDANNTGIKSISVAGYAVDLSCPFPQNESVVQAGASHTYRINVTNTGTLVDNITLTIDNPTSWTANFNNNPITKSDSDSQASKARPVNGYHTYSEIEAELNATVAAHPDICQLYSIGTTWESRQLWVLKISDNPTVNESEPEVYMNGGIHAREWIGEEVVLCYMNWLVDNYGTDPRATWLVDNRQIYLSPCVNPDGFVYSQTTGDWRKNRRNNGDGTYGVDLNRNWGGSCNGDPNGAWGVGESHTTSSETYCGPSAFSEPETQAMRNFILAHNFQITITYHSFGEELYWPWGYSTTVQAPHNALLTAVGTALAAESGYTPMQSSFLYTTTGDTDDWIYGYSWYNLSKIVSAHTIELATSFQPAQSEIIPICVQNLGTNQLAAEIADNLYLNSPVITHTPLPDTTNTAGPYVVSADITSPVGLQAGATTLYWQTSGAWTPVTMINTGGNTWTGNIPGQPDGTWVRYYVETMDTNLHKSSTPKYTPYAFFDFFVGNDVVEYTVTLDPLESFLVNFTVQAPSGALPNEYAIIDVIGTSDHDITKTDSVSTKTTVMPGILLVNDGNSGIAAYQLALDNNGYLYDVGTPSSELSNYRIVIWATDGSTPLDATERTKIENFINAGGSLYINGEDLGYSANSLGWMTWFNANLHAMYLADSSGGTVVNGVTGDPITDGMSNYDISGSYPEAIGLADGSASTIFRYNDAATRTGALKADTGTYKLVYIGFEYYEGTTDSQANKDLLMYRILEWLNPDLPPTVNLINPAGNEQVFGDVIDVTWVASDDIGLPAGCIDLYYMIDGENWLPLASGLDDTGHYLWDTTAVADSFSCKVRIVATDSVGQTGSSQSPFYFSIDNVQNDVWFFQMENLNLPPDLDLDMKPCEAAAQEIFTDVTGAGEFFIRRFASEYAATGDTDLAGTWEFSAFGKVSSAVADGNLYANVYADDGATSRLLFTTGYCPDMVGSHLAYNEFYWSYGVSPGTPIFAGEHVVVELVLHATGGAANSPHYNYPTADIPVIGTVTGNYTRLLASDNSHEGIAEIGGVSGTLYSNDFSVNPTDWTITSTEGTSWTWSSANQRMEHTYGFPNSGYLDCPVIDCTGRSGVTLNFWHYWEADYSGATQDGYVRGSINGGATWPYLIDEFHHNDPATETAVKQYTLAWAADQSQVRIRYDIYNYNDWYWRIDNFFVNGTIATSLCEHKWTVNVPVGENPYNFTLEARRANNPEDNFVFAYSTDDVNYTNMVTVNANTDTIYNYLLPGALSGTVYIRVRDTDRTPGNINLASVEIDHMYISSVGGAPTLTIGFDHYSTPSYVKPKLAPATIPTFNIPVLLSPGWNFISYPLLASGAPQVVLNDAAGDGLTTWNIIRWYDPNDASDHWKSYATFTPASLNDLSNLNNTMGLWIYITQVGDGYLTVQAGQPTSTNVILKAGWNLVGYPSLTPRLASTTLPPSADIVGIFNNTDPYKTTDMAPTAVTMQPGKAYWVHCTVDAVWTVPW